MKFNAALALAIPAVALASEVLLVVESADPRFDNKGIENLHFGAGINGALLTDSVTRYQFDEGSGNIFETIQTNQDLVPFTMGVYGHGLMLQAGYGGLESTKVVDGLLTSDGFNSRFFACKNLEFDPYGFTRNPNTYGIGVYDGEVPYGCTPIRITVRPAVF